DCSGPTIKATMKPDNRALLGQRQAPLVTRKYVTSTRLAPASALRRCGRTALHPAAVPLMSGSSRNTSVNDPLAERIIRWNDVARACAAVCVCFNKVAALI